MKRYKVELWFIIAGAAIVGLLLFLQDLRYNSYHKEPFASILGVPLDDVYIHCRYAVNLLARNEYSFNPGLLVTADTSPLWVVLLAIGGLFTSQIHIVAIALSSLFYLFLAPSAYRLSLSLGLDKRWSILSGVCTLLAARIVWSAPSGMEITLACLLAALAIKTHIQSINKPSYKEAILLALGIAVRPELMFLAGLCFVDWVVALRRMKKSYKDLLSPTIVFVLMVSPVFMLPLLERDSFVYHSSVVQGAGLSIIPNVSYLYFAFRILLISVAPPVLFALVSPFYFFKDEKWRLLILFGLGLPSLLSFVAPQFRHHGRYFFPVIPILIVLGIGVLSKLLGKAGIAKLRICVQIALCCFALVGSAIWTDNYVNCVSNINDQHVAAAEWIKKNAKPTDIIAAQDVGAIGYFTKRNIIDLVGLVSPDMFRVQHDQKQVWKMARAQGANLFFIYKRLNPSFYEYAKDSLELETEWRVTPPLIASADTVFSLFRVKGAVNASR